MKRALLALAFASTAFPASAAPVVVRPRISIVVAPASVVNAAAGRSFTSVGLGVMPGARTLRSFLAGIAAGSPDTPGGFANDLRASGNRIGGTQNRNLGLIDAFGPSETDPFQANLFLVEAIRREEIPPAVAAASRTIFIVASEQLPATVVVMGTPGLLLAPDVKRAGVVTPYDISALVRDVLKSDARIAGAAPASVNVQERNARIEALRARMRRDEGADAAPSQTSSSFGIFAGLFGGIFALRGRRRIAEALARGAVMMPLGYLAGMFLQTGNGAVRSVPVGIAFGIGVLAKPKDSRRFCGIALLATAGILAVLTVAAALRPDGEPALSLWGNPLTSWRFFGLRNHLVAFLAGSALLGACLLRVKTRTLAGIALATIVVVGAPQLGANYVGVFTTVFAFAWAFFVMRETRVTHAARTARWWHPVAALVTGAVATLLALWSDTGAVSHGGRALNTVESGGASAFWRIVRERALLDYHEVADIGWAAFIAVALMIAIATYLIRWALRESNAAVLTLTAAAMLALFVEDSGFFTAGTLMLYPAIGFALARAAAADTTTAPAPG